MPTLMDIAGGITPIIDTFQAGSLKDRPESVRSAYEPNADRYFATDAMRRVRDNLVRRLERGERALGRLIGPYGHGKTAAAIYLWRECEKAGVAAVPPFQFASFDDLVEAVSGWLRHAVTDRRPELIPQVEELTARYRGKTLEHRTLELARTRGIALEVARTIVEKDIAPLASIGGAAHASDFLEAAARLARDSGYKGLVVFADEMQLFLEEGDSREKTEDLRRLVLALRPTDAPLGLMLVIHERVAMFVAENAGDAMQRLEDDGVATNLQDNVGVTFPRDLLADLCRKASCKLDAVADEAVLEALGQITQRADLSNGPRSVAAAIRCIARHYAEKGKPYRVQDLAEDYQSRRIVFDGVERSLSGALAQLLGDDVVRADARYAQVVQYLCMFPQGAPEQYLRKAGLDHALNELATGRGLLGTVIYAPKAEHWALKALQLEVGSEDRLTELVRYFRDQAWYHTNTAQKIAIGRQSFIRYVLPDLFPRRGQGDAARKFGGHASNGDLTGRDPEQLLLCGTFEGSATHFPDRRVAVVVGTSTEAMAAVAVPPEAHLVFAFHLLSMGESAGPQRMETANRDPRVDLLLNIDVSVADVSPSHEFPPELQLLRDSIVPRLCTANVLLNLILFIEERLPKITMPEADRQQVREYLLRSARRYVIHMLLPADIASQGIAPQGRGMQLMESAFKLKLSELYPEYRAIHTGREADTDIDRYTVLLKEGGLRLGVKRGQQPIRLTTSEFLAKVGASSASQFDATASRLKSLGLLNIAHELSVQQDGPGRRARSFEFTLTEHPLETRFRQEVSERGLPTTVRRGGRDRDTKRLAKAILERLGASLGYTPTEIATALDLARCREWLDVDDDAVALAVPDADPDALRHEATELLDELTRLAAIDSDHAQEAKDNLSLMLVRLDAASPEDLSDISIELRLIHEGNKGIVRAAARQLRANEKELEEQARSLVQQLPESRLAETVALPGAIGGRLDEIRRRLQRACGVLRTESERLAAEMRGAHETEVPDNVADLVQQRADTATASEACAVLRGRVDALRTTVQNLDRWKTLALRARRLDEVTTDHMPELAAKLGTWSDDVVTVLNAAVGEAIPVILARWGEFGPALDALVAEHEGQAAEATARFRSFHAELSRLMGNSGLPEPREPAFNWQDAERAYGNLAADVIRVVTDGLKHASVRLAQVEARCAFLKEFRQRDVTQLVAAQRTAQARVKEALQQISEPEVQLLRHEKGRLPAVCGAHQAALAEANRLAQAIAALEKADPPKAGLEHTVMVAVQRRSRQGPGADDDAVVHVGEVYQDVRREQRVGADELFEALHQLYVEGNLEILVRLRR